MYIALFVGTVELNPSTNQTISVCSFILQATVNWMGVREKGNVYLVSVEVPVGTEEKSYDEDGVDLYLYVNCDGVCVRISLCLCWLL